MAMVDVSLRVLRLLPLEDAKWIIKSRKLKDRKHNGQKKKRQNYNYQQIDFDFCCLMPLSAIFMKTDVHRLQA
jgi:hypothetical protein